MNMNLVSLQELLTICGTHDRRGTAYWWTPRAFNSYYPTEVQTLAANFLPFGKRPLESSQAGIGKILPLLAL